MSVVVGVVDVLVLVLVGVVDMLVLVVVVVGVVDVLVVVGVVDLADVLDVLKVSCRALIVCVVVTSSRMSSLVSWALSCFFSSLLFLSSDAVSVARRCFFLLLEDEESRVVVFVSVSVYACAGDSTDTASVSGLVFEPLPVSVE